MYAVLSIIFSTAFFAFAWCAELSFCPFMDCAIGCVIAFPLRVLVTNILPNLRLTKTFPMLYCLFISFVRHRC